MILKLRNLFPVLIIFVVAISLQHPVAAEATWPVSERCVGEATSPPDGWTFEGTLLLTSPGRLHAYQHGWETSRILVFYDENSNGILSPNGEWYALVDADSRVQGAETTWNTHAIQVYSTVNDEKYTVDWENQYKSGYTVRGHRLHWLDDEHLLYSRGDKDEMWFVINLFSGEVTEWQANFSPSWDYFVLSQDGEKAVYRNFDELNWRFHNGEQEIELQIIGDVRWRPDSSGFAAFTQHPEATRADQFALFNLDGEITDVLYGVPRTASVNATTANSWSTDNRYVIFVADHLFMIDTQNHEVIDTCVVIPSSLNVAWSPLGNQVALVMPSGNKREIQILDMERWERYFIGNSSGPIIGWRNDE